MDLVHTLYTRYAEELNAVKANMQTALDGVPCNAEMGKILAEIIGHPGKMLRPLLMILLAGDVTKAEKEEILATAAGLELAHTSSLVLDDMLDRAAVRRGIPTVVNAYGDSVALCVGDYILAASFRYLLERNYPLGAMEVVTVTQKCCNGEMIQDLNRKNTEISEKTYLEAIRGKTAYLFCSVCSIASRITRRPPEVTETLFRYGEILGTLFQLRDDLLDWTAGAEELGKPVNKDFREGIYTLPAIFTFRHPEYGPELKALAARAEYSDEDLERARFLARAAGGIAYTRETMRQLAEEGMNLTGRLPGGEPIRETAGEIIRILCD